MVSGVPKRLGPVLRRLREGRGLTQRQLIDAVINSGGKLSSGHLAEIENGNRGASRDKVDELALAMGLDEKDHAALLTAAGHPTEGTVAVANLSKRLTLLEVAVRKLTDAVENLEDRIPDGS